MLSLTYLSSATHLLSEPELRALLAHCRAKNEQLGLSGMLLYSDGNFIQTLEGPEDVVRATYRTISQDPRHRGHIVVLEEQITERSFPEWSMGFRDMGRPPSGTDGLTRVLQGGEVDAHGAGAAPKLLRIFRDSVR